MPKVPCDNSMDPTAPVVETGPRTPGNPLNRPDEWLRQFLLSKKILKGKRYSCPSRNDCRNDHKTLRPLLRSLCTAITMTKYALKGIYVITFFLALFFYSQYLTLKNEHTAKARRDIAYALLIAAYIMVPGILVASWMNMVYEVVDRVHGLGVLGTWRFPRRGGSFLVDLVVGIVMAVAFWAVWMVDRR
ncbi:hypothetical protein TWF481_010954 [Arthrobotrys musiformis]|uniref:Uncharacterized protein n=1 Tax=Arthrobotrys musiformis TaxID=47236 RepID=A0AAV9VYD4_9PEZI